MQTVISILSTPLLSIILTVLIYGNALQRSGIVSKLASQIFSANKNYNTLFVVYVYVIIGVILSSFIPSSTLRAAGIVLPLISVVLCNREYILQSYIQCEDHLSYLFITSMAATAYMIEFVRTNCHVDITFQTWISYSWLPVITCCVNIPLALWLIFKPSRYTTFVNHKIAEITWNDVKLILLFAITILAFVCLNTPRWIIGACSITVAILCSTLVVGDFKNKLLFKITLTLVLLIGVSKAISFEFLKQYTGFLPMGIRSIILVCLFYVYSQYLFSTSTSHLLVLFPVCFYLIVNCGLNEFNTALLLAYLSNTSSIITPVSCGYAPSFFSLSSMNMKQWCVFNGVFSLIHSVVVFCYCYWFI